MPSRRLERGNALLMAIIVVLVITVAGVAVIRLASREVAGAQAGRKAASVSACTEAARNMLMGQWKLLGTHDVGIPPLKLVLESATPTEVRGGHYGQDPQDFWDEDNQSWIRQVQVLPLNPLLLGTKNQANDISNRVGDAVIPYRVVVHCTQGTPPDARELELEFGVQYGL